MKFTKQEFSERLKTRLTDGGKKPMQQSERTFSKLVEKIYSRLEKRDDDEELENVVDDYLSDFEEIEGNLRKDNSDFIKKWQTEHPEPTPKPKPTGLKDDESDDRLQKLMDKLDAMERRQNERDKEEKIALKRKAIKAALKKEGIDNAKWIDGYVEKLRIDEDSDVDSEKADALALWNIVVSKPNKKTPGGTGGDDGEPDLKYLE